MAIIPRPANAVRAHRNTCSLRRQPAGLEGGWGALELDLADLFTRVPERVVYEDVITYPELRQDVAFTGDEGVAAAELVDAAREAAGPELREIEVFDVYRGEQLGE